MAITETPETVDSTRLKEPPARRRARRSMRGRLSSGHWVMIIAGVLAALVNVAALRAGGETIRVAVAAEQIDAGQIIEAGMLRFVDLAADDQLLAGLVTADAIATVTGAVTASPIAAGDPVLRSALVRGTEGRRTMSVPIDPAHAAGGRLVAGDRVDVISVADGLARFIAEDVEVVGVADRGSGALGTVGAYHVTLAVDADTALRVALAMRTTTIELVRATGAEPLTGAARRGHRTDQPPPDEPGTPPDR
jgi:Flp pilus assembly protein CpaB